MEENKKTQLRQALETLVASPTQKHRAALAAELLKSKILAPAVWDKAPVPDGHGQLAFPPDTNVSLMVLERDGKRLFPFFTDQQELARWNPKTQCLVLTFDQFLPFIQTADDNIDGIILDADSLDVILDKDFVLTLAKVKAHGMQPTRIARGDKVTVKDPGDDMKYLANVLAKEAEKISDINWVVLKERLMPDGSSHWLIIVDTIKDDPAMLSRLAKEGMRLANGKDLEFMFGDTELGAKIGKDSKKIYEKKMN